MARRNYIVVFLLVGTILIVGACSVITTRGLLLKGEASMDRNEYREALAYFDRALTVDPENPEVHYARGIALYRLTRDGDAVSEFTAAILLDPEYSWAYYSRGLAHKRMGNVDGALADFSDALKYAPKTQEFYYSRAMLYRELGKIDEALSDFVSACDFGNRDACFEIKRLQERKMESR